MRAKEFVTEYKQKIPKRQQEATTGLHLFRDREFADRFYELNRVMIAAGCNDGVNGIEVPEESWIGRYNTAHPYTQVEADKLKHAYKVIGSSYKDLNGGNLNSQELELVNKQSPIKPFKGYKK